MNFFDFDGVAAVALKNFSLRLNHLANVRLITNTVKHSGADNLWITVSSVEEAIEVSARDDGHSLAITRPGAGLTGMKDRFESLGGRVEFSLQGNAGFALRAQLPAQSRDRFA